MSPKLIELKQLQLIFEVDKKSIDFYLLVIKIKTSEHKLLSLKLILFKINFVRFHPIITLSACLNSH